MNSLEALEHIIKRDYNQIICTIPAQQAYNGLTQEDMIDIVKKDLYVLEIIKANKNIIFSKKPNYEDMSANDFLKISRWLENVES